jgi:coenzyme PQQ biosynthesis protein C
VNVSTSESFLPEAQFVARFHAIGEERYHHKHPFHLLMHEGKLTRGQLQAWALNRYYYQSRIPIKDATILARSEDAEFRRAWRKRIFDHDGDATHPGGIEKWLRLVEATGLTRDQALRGDAILPAVRYAVDAYLELVRSATFLEAVASSLTELFSGKLIALRMDALRRYYPWLSGGLDYFQGRLTQAPEDADFRAGLGRQACSNTRAAGTCAGRATREVQYSLGPTRCRVFCLRVSGVAAAGGFSTPGGLKYES